MPVLKHWHNLFDSFNCSLYYHKEELIADLVEDPKYDTSSRQKVKLTDEIIRRFDITFLLNLNLDLYFWQKEGFLKPVLYYI